MPLTRVQQGKIGEMESAKLMMMSSDGLLEVANPLTDDERRDEEVHVRGDFGLGIAIQMKTTMVLQKVRKRVSPIVEVRFSEPARRLVNHPLFWYLFAYLDRETMDFRDPIFLIDSATFHKRGLTWRRGERVYLKFRASLTPKSRDVWAPYKVRKQDLGKRILQIISDARNTPRLGRITEVPADPGFLLVRKARTNRLRNDRPHRKAA